MEKSFLLRRSFAIFLIACLLSPLLHLLFFVPIAKVSGDPDLLPMLGRSLLQASLSTLITLTLASLGAVGLSSWADSNPYRRSSYLQVACLLPGVLPPLVLVLLVSTALSTLFIGLWGVVFFHVLMNVGLLSLLLHQAMEESLEVYWQQAQLMGCGSWRFLFRIFWPLMRKTFFNLGTYLFVLFFLSFSVPLLLGGVAYAGPEAFVFYRVVEIGSWSESVILCLGLFVFLLLATPVLSRNAPHRVDFREFRAYRSRWWRLALVVPILPSLLLIGGLLRLSPHLRLLLDAQVWSGFKVSLLSGLGTGLLTFFSMSLICFIFSQKYLRTFLLSWLNPGWVLVGFSFLLLRPEGGAASVVFLILALWLVFLPFLYRLGLDGKLGQLQGQVEIAQSFPSSWASIFLRVIWPQALPMIALLSGVAALWASGDFAMSELLLSSPQVESMAMKVKVALETYQLERAQVQLFPLLLLGFGLFFLFQGMSYVGGQKSLSRSRSISDRN